MIDKLHRLFLLFYY